jgi:type IV secretory pathway TraG/TraD family ATPase VirD4
MVLTQSLADLDLIYGEKERRVMMDNFNFKAVFLCNENDTQKYFSDLAGTAILKRSTTSQQTVDDGVSVSGRGSYTETEYREKLIQPEEFGRLSQKHELILFHQAGFVRLKRAYYYKLDKGYNRRARKKATIMMAKRATQINKSNNIKTTNIENNTEYLTDDEWWNLHKPEIDRLLAERRSSSPQERITALELG